MRRKSATACFLALLMLPALAAATEYRKPAGIANLTDPEVVTGYKALFTCSAHFFAGRPLEDIRKVELEEMSGLGYPDPVIDEARRFVSATDPSGTVTRIAAFRDSMGCAVLAPEWGPEDIARLPELPYVPAPDLRDVAFPAGDRVELGADGFAPGFQSLGAALDRAFRGDYGSKPGAVTAAVIVLKGGRIVAERYRPGFGIHSGYRTWSTSKSITALLLGIAAKQGRLDLEGRADIPEWAGPQDPRGRITYKQLMWMSSGLASGGDNSYAVYFGGQDAMSAITDNALEVPPGTRWKYANNDTLLLARALRHVIGDDEKFLRYPYEELLRPLGMHHTRMETDHLGMFVASSQTYTTARDLARLGLFLDRDGVWNGKRYIPGGFLAFAATPAPTRPPAAGQWGYGAQFWLLDQMPGVPAGTYTTAGRKGQFVTVVPGHDLVIVRTGVDPEGIRFQQDRLVADVVAALKKKD
ncbi:MAG TPA: serine hydrolase domain-containing protein [Burkholderiales bacterium]|nr:serine hydrolase domain-containing protein [Burkholderiales bacterium]